MSTPELEALRAFRHQVYTRLGCRRDALFELVDATLTAPAIETPAHLSLVPSCQRRWGSLYEALNAGTMDVPPLEALIAVCPNCLGRRERRSAYRCPERVRWEEPLAQGRRSWHTEPLLPKVREPAAGMRMLSCT